MIDVISLGLLLRSVGVEYPLGVWIGVSSVKGVASSIVIVPYGMLVEAEGS